MKNTFVNSKQTVFDRYCSRRLMFVNSVLYKKPCFHQMEGLLDLFFWNTVFAVCKFLLNFPFQISMDQYVIRSTK